MRTTPCGGDCDDTDASVHPGVPDVCNGRDDDCDGSVDEDFSSSVSTCGSGICRRQGVTSCIAGVFHDSCVPGAPAPEVCDGLDNDCDGLVDDFPAPVGSPQLLVVKQSATIARLILSFQGQATGFDVMRGWLYDLLTYGGDFSQVLNCMGSNAPPAGLTDSEVPAAGQAFWYVARAKNCNVGGTYNSGSASQVGSRDAGIQASGIACP